VVKNVEWCLISFRRSWEFGRVKSSSLLL
jgi:hypothetical protein